MSEWYRCSLGSLATYINGYAFKPEDFSPDGRKIIRIEQLNNPDGKYDHVKGLLPRANLIENGDLIFSWSATLKVKIWVHGSAVLNQHLFKVIPKEHCDKLFLMYLLDFYIDDLAGMSHGSTMKHIKRGDLDAFMVDIPRREKEQRELAKIICTIDAQITQTQSLIDKYTAIKQGMMADLFSRGIDTTTGQLRPTFEEAPELYKETELGWVPMEWDVFNMSDIASDEKGSTVIGPFGSDLVASDYKKEGVPIVFVRDVKEAGLNWVSNTFISTEKARQLAAHTVRAGDVVATKMGLPPCVSAVYQSELPSGIITADIIRLRPNLQRVLPKWIADTLNSDFVKRQVEEITAGVTRPKVTLKDFRLLKSKYPPLHEQTLILHRLSALENLLSCECKKVQILVKQKKGLMQDLLTGRVPVPA